MYGYAVDASDPFKIVRDLERASVALSEGLGRNSTYIPRRAVGEPSTWVKLGDGAEEQAYAENVSSL